MTPDRSPAAGAPSATPAPTPAPTPATGPAADASVPWPPALLPTDAPRRPGAVPWASAVLDAPLPAGADPELSAAALAALLYRCTGQERMALAGPDGELRFRITDGATLRDLAANATRAAATGATTVAFAAGPDPAPHGAPFELVVSVQGDTVRLRHDPELFERGTAARLLAHYGTLLADALRTRRVR
ncbi:hypothetical protein SVIOM342S_00484 [Streptomyces violaceorubidus]